MNKIKKINTAVIWLILVMIATCLFAIQYITLPKIKYFILSSFRGDSIETLEQNAMKLFMTGWASVFSSLDFVIISFLFFLIFGLVFSEIFRNRLSEFFSQLNSHPKELTAFLLFMSVLFTRYYLNPGQIFMGDTGTHTVRSWMVSQHLKNLQLPVWSNYWYGGYPLLHYYAPLFFVVTASFNLIFNDIHLATKLVLWLTHIGSVLTMFYFLRESTKDSFSALLGSFAYALVFHRVHIVLYAGDLQLSLIFLIYPLIFFIIERYLNGRSSPKNTFLLFSLVTSSLILSHHGYAFFGLIFLCVYLFIRVMTWGNTRVAIVKTLAFFAIGTACAFMISSFLLLPFITEIQDVRGLPQHWPFRFFLPSVPKWKPFYKMLRWTTIGDTTPVGYVGISLAAFSLLSIVYIVKKRISVGIALLVCSVATIYTLKTSTHYNAKNINFFVFFITALTAYMPYTMKYLLLKTPLHEKLNRKWGNYIEAKIFLLLILIMLVDLGPTTFQNVFRENYDFKKVMYEHLLNIDKNNKVIERQITRYDPTKDNEANFDPTKLGIVSAHSDVQTPLGWFHEGSGKSSAYNTEMVKKLHVDINKGYISDLSFKGLFLMGVKFLIFRDRYHYFPPPLNPSLYYTINDAVLELKNTRPLLMTTRVLHVKDLPDYVENNIIERGRYFDAQSYDYENMPYEQIVKPLIEKMNIHLDRGVADFLIVRGADIPSSKDDTQDIDVQIKSFSVDIDTVTIRYLSNESGFGRLAYSYFPYLDARLDGERTPFYRSAMSYIIVALPKGEHIISIQGTTSPRRRFAFFFSIAAVFVVVLLPPRILTIFAHGK